MNTPLPTPRSQPPQPSHWAGVIRRYAEYLPVTADTPVVTLLEGNTPLVAAPQFVEAIGGKFQLYLKYEALNPTGSFKDRGMTVAISKAKERGAQVVICASTGNTSASAAAYAARARLKCVVLLPKGKIAQGKLAQALMYGATTIALEGNFDDALRIVRELGETGHVEVVNSINPLRIEGQKTAAFRHAPAPVRLPGGGRRADRRWTSHRRSANGGLGHPHRQPGELAGRVGRDQRFPGSDRQSDRRRDPRRLQTHRPH